MKNEAQFIFSWLVVGTLAFEDKRNDEREDETHDQMNRQADKIEHINFLLIIDGDLLLEHLVRPIWVAIGDEHFAPDVFDQI